MSKKEKSSVFNIVAFNFAGKDTAKETVKEIEKSGALKGQSIVAEAIVEQNEKGKVHIHEPGRGGVGTSVGAVGDELSGQIAAYAAGKAHDDQGNVVAQIEAYNAFAKAEEINKAVEAYEMFLSKGCTMVYKLLILYLYGQSGNIVEFVIIPLGSLDILI